ncbi:MAG: L,D-transpeptidase family protein [Alphaproteobacteria bacterium]
MKSRLLFAAAFGLFGAFSVHSGALAEQGIVIERAAVEVDPRVFEALDAVSAQYPLKHAKALRAFYEARGAETYWDRGNVSDFIEVIEGSWTHALNPFSYHLDALNRDDLDPMHREVLLSDAYVSYGRDISGIRVDPRVFKSHRRYWQAPLSVDALLDHLNRDDDIDDVVAGFTPRGNTYNLLRKELRRLVDEGAPEYEGVLPIRVKGLLKPGEEHAALADVRVRLGVRSGSFDAVYDDVLAAAVMRFQEQHGLKPDAVIGPGTLRAMNYTHEDRIKQVLANLERLRWVPEEKPERFIVVNVPSATLWAIDEGRVEIEMPVIVGRKKRPTNIFITDITGVRLNPTWTVPPTIKREDILPKLVEDPYYLVSKGMELVSAPQKDGDGQVMGAMSVDPASIDWAVLTDEDLKGMRMVQTPGAHNPLGRVRVLMPNGYNIYLHDTNEKYLFNRAGRAVSSGCVRLKRPFEIANFILQEKKDWSQERLDEILDAGKMRDLYIRETMPVYLVYYTSWVNEDGRVVYGNDVYGYDKILIKMLSELDGIFIPVDNNGIYGG